MVSNNTLPDIFTEKDHKKREKRYRKQQYYIHSNTSNHSFLKLHRSLETLGIENNDFFLAIYDKRIASLDPFDENLTPVQQILIMNECKNNFWYFARECVRIEVPGSTNLGKGGGKPYAIHRGNAALTWCVLNNIDLFLELPRQNFKSVSVDVILTWLYIFGTTNSSMLIMNKAHDDAKVNLDRIKGIRDALPYYLRFNTKKNADGKVVKVSENRESITHHKTNNSLVTKPSATSKDAADKLGRGLTQPVLWFDEFAFLKFNMIIYESASPAYRQAAIEAETNKRPHCKIITTTPGDMQTEFGRDAFDFKNKSVKFKEEFYDWKIKEVKEFIRNNSSNGFVNIIFSYKQLGRASDYLEQMESDLGGNWLKVRREVLLEWVSINNESPFDKDDLDEIRELSANKKPIKSIYIDKYYELVLYENINTQNKIILSSDVASGTSRDFSTIALIDSKTKRCIGELKNNKVDTLQFSVIIHTIATQILFGKCIIAIERNNVGSSVITNLLKTDVKSLIYYERDKDVLQEKLKKGREVHSDSQTIKFGIWTDEVKRQEMFDILARFVKDYKDRITTETLAEQICALVYDKKGRVDHPDNGHDDMVMGYLIGMWMYYHGNNTSSFGLVKYPDIDPSTGMTEDEALFKMEQEQIERDKERLDAYTNILDDSDKDSNDLISNTPRFKTIDDYYNQIDNEMVDSITGNSHSTLMNALSDNNFMGNNSIFNDSSSGFDFGSLNNDGYGGDMFEDILGGDF